MLFVWFWQMKVISLWNTAANTSMCPFDFGNSKWLSSKLNIQFRIWMSCVRQKKKKKKKKKKKTVLNKSFDQLAHPYCLTRAFTIRIRLLWTFVFCHKGEQMSLAIITVRTDWFTSSVVLWRCSNEWYLKAEKRPNPDHIHQVNESVLWTVWKKPTLYRETWCLQGYIQRNLVITTLFVP